MHIPLSTLYRSRADVEAIDAPMKFVIAVVGDAPIEKSTDAGNCRRNIGWSVMSIAARGRPCVTGMLILNTLEQGLESAVVDSPWVMQQSGREKAPTTGSSS